MIKSFCGWSLRAIELSGISGVCRAIASLWLALIVVGVQVHSERVQAQAFPRNQLGGQVPKVFSVQKDPYCAALAAQILTDETKEEWKAEGSSLISAKKNVSKVEVTEPREGVKWMRFTHLTGTHTVVSENERVIRVLVRGKDEYLFNENCEVRQIRYAGERVGFDQRLCEQLGINGDAANPKQAKIDQIRSCTGVVQSAFDAISARAKEFQPPGEAQMLKIGTRDGYLETAAPQTLSRLGELLDQCTINASRNSLFRLRSASSANAPLNSASQGDNRQRPTR